MTQQDPSPARAARPALPWYRREPWLAVLAAAFVPILLALVAPAPLRMPLLGVSAVLMAAGLTMLVRHDRRVREVPDTTPDATPGAP